jgi:hypothetical protein
MVFLISRMMMKYVKGAFLGNNTKKVSKIKHGRLENV